MQETNPPHAQASDQCIYEGIAEELRKAGFAGITLLLIRDVHRDMVQGRSQTDIIGRTIVHGLQQQRVR